MSTTDLDKTLLVPPQALASLDRGGLEATLALDLAPDRLTGCTRIASCAAEPPLRVIRAFALPDGAALVHLHNVSGGLLGDDSLHLSVNAAARSAVQLTTTGATRIYRSRLGAEAAMQSNEIRVAEDALLEYVPDAIIPFAGARFSQHTRIHLDPGAGLFWWEILAPGREARGEVFEYDRVEMRTEILAAGRLIAVESFRLEPRRRALSSHARLGPFRYAASFYICRVGLDPAAWLAAEAHLRAEAASFTSSASGPATLWGVSTLAEHGLAIRCLAREGHGVLAGLHAFWRAAKLHLFGREPIPPRKVH